MGSNIFVRLCSLVLILWAQPGRCHLYWDKYDSSVPSGANLTAHYKVASWRSLPDYLTHLRVRVICPYSQGEAGKHFLLDYPFLDTVLQDPSQRGGAITIGPLLTVDNTDVLCEFEIYKRRLLGSYAAYLPIHSPGRHMFKITSRQVTQVHLSLLSDHMSGMRVMWKGLANGSASTPSVVYRPTFAPDLWAVANASQVQQYTAEDMLGPPSSLQRHDFFRSPGTIFQATLPALTPGTQYTYTISGDDEKRQFRMPGSVKKSHHAHIVALGNMGVFHDKLLGKSGAATNRPSPAVTAVLKRLKSDLVDSSPSHGPDVVVHLGNLAYASGRGFVWDYFMHYIEPLASHIPYHVIAGAAEVDYAEAPAARGLAKWATASSASGGEGGVPLSRRFAMPGSEGGGGGDGGGVFWYSHSVGNARLVYISTEHDLAPGSVQHAWLERELSSVDRSRHPWLFVAGHRPLYASQGRVRTNATTAGDTFEPIELRQQLNSLLHAYHVNVYLSAYHSSYVRTCPMDVAGKCVDDRTAHGVIHLTCGTAGAPLDAADPTPGRESWVAKHVPEHGYCDIRTKSARRALFRFRSVTGELDDVAVVENTWREGAREERILAESEKDKPVVLSASDVEEWRSSSSAAAAADVQRAVAFLSLTITGTVAVANLN